MHEILTSPSSTTTTTSFSHHRALPWQYCQTTLFFSLLWTCVLLFVSLFLSLSLPLSFSHISLSFSLSLSLSLAHAPSLSPCRFVVSFPLLGPFVRAHIRACQSLSVFVSCVMIPLSTSHGTMMGVMHVKMRVNIARM